MKKLLFHIKNLPYLDVKSEEIIETILLAGSLEYEVGVYFSGLGVRQLVQQQPEAAVKNLAKVISAFPAFSIHSIYACAESVQKYIHPDNELVLAFETIKSKKKNKLYKIHDVIIEV